jgi:DNA-binding CsgD family transcriptional regulator
MDLGTLHLDVVEQPELDDVHPELRVLNDAKGVDHLFLRGHEASLASPVSQPVLIPRERGTLFEVAVSEQLGHRLQAAVEAVASEKLLDSLSAVVRAMPIPLGVETVGIRVRARDGERAFYLLASEGLTPHDVARRALEPFPLVLIRSFLALGPAHSMGRSMGIRWSSGRWMTDGDEPIGVVLVGSRTERTPTREQEQLITQTADGLAARLKPVDRSTGALELLAASLATDALADPGGQPIPALDGLRPRERTILGLYAEGLSAEEIAKMLFISPHTVRTHVKNAFRRLGIHSRNEAAELVHTDELARVI